MRWRSLCVEAFMCEPLKCVCIILHCDLLTLKYVCQLSELHDATNVMFMCDRFLHVGIASVLACRGKITPLNTQMYQLHTCTLHTYTYIAYTYICILTVIICMLHTRAAHVHIHPSHICIHLIHNDIHTHATAQ